MKGWKTIGKYDNLQDLQDEIDKRKLKLMINCFWIFNILTKKYELKSKI